MEAALAKKVEIVVESNVDAEGRLHIIVADDGPGVPPGMAEKVFSPFFTTKEEGTGLGLATVAQILRAAKGEVHLEPSAVGAKFRLIVPTANIINRSSGRSS